MRNTCQYDCSTCLTSYVSLPCLTTFIVVSILKGACYFINTEVSVVLEDVLYIHTIVVPCCVRLTSYQQFALQCDHGIWKKHAQEETSRPKYSVYSCTVQHTHNFMFFRNDFEVFAVQSLVLVCIVISLLTILQPNHYQ